MTDLKKIAEKLENSQVKLTKEFWEEQNRKLDENRKRFAEQNRKMRVSPELLNRRFDV